MVAFSDDKNEMNKYKSKKEKKKDRHTYTAHTLSSSSLRVHLQTTSQPRKNLHFSTSSFLLFSPLQFITA
ncbi:hypothetical protein QVD17_34060 [Tagetes erecta]|uniref:Uncharacterized protein n=1 Tax=Tagetes erecta TaxID=13708 RepID=A0AAD8JXF2_TARER|nr:hypothetical protein QVD17_34060 [Tagetes erecta]